VDRATRIAVLGFVCRLASTLLEPGSPATAAVRAGSEFQVNSFTAAGQRMAAVGIHHGGDFVVVWESQGQDGSSYGVFGRRFASSGAALGGEFQVNTFTPGFQRYPRVAVLPAGDFVVVWHSELQDGAEAGVFGQRFATGGAAQGEEFQVNTVTLGYQGYPAIAMHTDGFIVTWWSDQDGTADVFARRFDLAGAPLGAELLANFRTPSNQFFPDVGLDGDGNAVFVWMDNNLDGNGNGVFVRRFDASDAPLDAFEYQVNAYTSGNQSFPRIAVADDGDFVVAWQSPNQDGGGSGVFARRLDATGALQGVELQVNTYTLGGQQFPVVALDGAGGFVVVWQDNALDGSLPGVFARRFSSSGQPQTGAFQVNTHTDLYQQLPSVAMNPRGDFVVAWSSAGQDGSGDGVFAQRFEAFADFDVDGNGATSALTDGLLILRYLFGLRDDALIDAAVGTGCTRCDAESIEPYLEQNL
jgi:hypothetical protein